MNRDDIKWLVLQELGVNERPDFNSSDSNEVKIINNQYEFILGVALEKYHWGFATKQTGLTKTAITDKKYSYSYDLPSDCLFVKCIYSDVKLTAPIMDFEIYDDKIYTNSASLYLDYVVKKCEEQLPYYFINYLKYLMARTLCHKITGDIQLEQILIANEQREYIEATNCDVRSKAIKVLPTGVFVDVRN